MKQEPKRIPRLIKAAPVAQPVLELDLTEARQFEKECYNLRSDRSRQVEFRHIQNKHRELFGTYADSDCPRVIVGARVQYKLLRLAYERAGRLGEIPTIVRARMDAVLKFRNDLFGLDPETTALYRAAESLYEGERTSTMAPKKVTKATEATETQTEAKAPGFKMRIDCLGHPVTAVLRWLGQQGYTVGQAKAAMTSLECPVNPATVQIQVNAGKNGQRGEPAQLTAKEIAELKRHIPSLESLAVAKAEAKAAEAPAPKPAPVAKKAPAPVPVAKKPAPVAKK